MLHEATPSPFTQGLGAHPAGTGCHRTRGQAALGHLTSAVHGEKEDLGFLDVLFALKVHLVSESISGNC